MKKLTIDIGIQEFEVNGEVLRFNPSDPNVYARFVAAAEKLAEIERHMVAKAETLDSSDSNAQGVQLLSVMENADKEVKNILGEVFGCQNDFNKILGGVNVMAVASNGERVITNFVNALAPILTKGAQNCARDQARDAAATLRPNRETRRSSTGGK